MLALAEQLLVTSNTKKKYRPSFSNQLSFNTGYLLLEWYSEAFFPVICEASLLWFEGVKQGGGGHNWEETRLGLSEFKFVIVLSDLICVTFWHSRRQIEAQDHSQTWHLFRARGKLNQSNTFHSIILTLFFFLPRHLHHHHQAKAK